MADVLNKQQRSYNMSMIKGKDTKPEEIVRKYLFSKGLRFRKNDKRYPGHPDMVFPKFHTVVFIHGCFWHRHPNCKYANLPSSNVEFWETKLNGNVERDKKEQAELEESGWKVLIIWECELKKNVREKNLELLYKKIIADEK